MRPLPISCFIIALNEEDRIGRAIRSVRGLVDEVIVLDSGSADRTRQVSEAEGARVVYQPWLGFGPQKRAGEELCRNAWILNIDADECITDELATEIRQVFERGPASVGYSVAVNIVYPGKSRPRPWARDCNCVRLYNSQLVRYSTSMVHDRVEMGDHAVKELGSPIYHYPVRSLSELVEKYRDRARYCGTHAKRRSAWSLRLRLLYELPFAFFKFYVARGHFTGGAAGFQYAALSALFRHWRVQFMLARAMPAEASAQALMTMPEAGVPGRPLS